MKYEQDDQRKHLEFIQLAINRMANNSFILKGWTITLIAGLFALTINKKTSIFLILALFPALAFWGLDAYYLRQEKLFRELYNHVRTTKREKIDPYSLNTKLVNSKVNNWFKTLFSSTIIALHGTMVFFIAIILIIVCLRR